MMKNEMTVFSNSELGALRALEINDEVYFVGNDVAEILGYSNPNKAIQVHVDDEDKKTLDFKGFSHFGKSLWGENDFSNKIVINESGVYALIFGSKLAKAKEFKRWVTHDVLPTIRKTGGYVESGREKEFIENNPAIVAELQQLRTAVEIMQAQLMATPDAYVQNTWKKNISQPLARKVQEKYAVGDKDAYKMIYVEMQSQFGFDGISAIMAYHHKYNLAQNVHVSAITAIADDKVYQGYFSQAANRLLAEREVTPDDLITAVAKALGYSKPCATVYSKIYSRMNTARGWKHMLTRHKCRTKKELIENNKEYGALYVKCCNEILDEHR